MIKYIRNDSDTTRFVVIVNAKVSKKAVKRNLARRRLYEILRKNYKAIQPGFDIMVNLSPNIITDDKVLSYDKIQESLLGLLKKSKLL